jgi:carboxypeptidase C (cathepsin A)
MHILLIAILACVRAARDSDLLEYFPGVDPQPDFKVYSGYLQLSNSPTSKQLHYVFVQHYKADPDAPVVLWLNGGPGCSSLDGFVYENGPYYFEDLSTELETNAYSWNKVAHMLYLESPAAVGFSILGSPSNNRFDDETTAEDNLIALIAFFSNFTEYRKNEFFISGESYAGVYVPWLARRILDYNVNLDDPSLIINLKGILIGNPLVNWNVDYLSAFPEFSYRNGLISQRLYKRWVNNGCTIFSKDNTCIGTLKQISSIYQQVNLYDIYRPCINTNYTYSKINHLHFGLSNAAGDLTCVDATGATVYFNDDKVREAFHIPEGLPEWTLCSKTIRYDMSIFTGSYEVLGGLIFNEDIRILIYSGDTDGCVPTLGTRKWIKMMNMTVSDSWRHWSTSYDQTDIAGYVMDFQEGLTFLTIKGTGHMSIQWKRPEGFDMFSRFLKDEKF